MRSASRSEPTGAAEPNGEAIVERTFAGGEGWSVREFVCRAGPSDRPFEERHDGFSVAAVIEGSFTYRSDAGLALLYPGALLLGNAGQCFECGHAHGRGDRCVSVNLHQDVFGEVAASAASTSGFRFSSPSLPPSPLLLPVVALIEAFAATASTLRCEELALATVERVIAATAGRGRSVAPPTTREARRVVDAIRTVESDATQPVSLQQLARVAGVSKYHFLRVFRRLTGMTPHQYLISARLRRAALALASSRRPVLAIALDSGFGDLSTFNHRFRAAFGVTPTQYRASAA